MALLASDIVNDVRAIVIDDESVEWTDGELLAAVSDAGRLLVSNKREAYPKREFVDMVQGTNQQLPADGVAIMDISQNQISKRSATIVDKEMLDHENRFWQAATGERDVQHWCADPRDPTRFDVTPPNDGTGSVLILYGALPPVLTSMSSPIVFLESYKYALTAFTLHRLYAEQSRKGDTVKSQAWLQNGLQALGINSTTQIAVAPKVSANPGQ